VCALRDCGNPQYDRLIQLCAAHPNITHLSCYKKWVSADLAKLSSHTLKFHAPFSHLEAVVVDLASAGRVAVCHPHQLHNGRQEVEHLQQSACQILQDCGLQQGIQFISMTFTCQIVYEPYHQQVFHPKKGARLGFPSEVLHHETAAHFRHLLLNPSP
jgi:hypothetical protein